MWCHVITPHSNAIQAVSAVVTQDKLLGRKQWGRSAGVLHGVNGPDARHAWVEAGSAVVQQERHDCRKAREWVWGADEGKKAQQGEHWWVYAYVWRKTGAGKKGMGYPWTQEGMGRKALWQQSYKEGLAQSAAASHRARQGTREQQQQEDGKSQLGRESGVLCYGTGVAGCGMVLEAALFSNDSARIK